MASAQRITDRLDDLATEIEQIVEDARNALEYLEEVPQPLDLSNEEERENAEYAVEQAARELASIDTDLRRQALAFAEWLNADICEGEEATTVEEYVSNLLAERAGRERDYAAKIKRAKHLWRGLKLDEPQHHEATKTIASNIQHQFEGNSHYRNYRNRLGFDLDDLIYLGEQIERLR